MWLMPVIPAPGRQRQENFEFKGQPGLEIAKPCLRFLKKKKA
jgi:hypothetical protein